MNQIKQDLEDLAIDYPHIVISKLAKGSVVNKSWGTAYEIDNSEIHKALCNGLPAGAIPYGKINKGLISSRADLYNLFENEGVQTGTKKIIPFSRIVDLGIGQCLEKAILVQLAAQEGRDSFLISGALEQDCEVGADPHAYNIVFKDGKPYLVDAENPFAKNGNMVPYIVPILGIEGKHGEVKVREELRDGRKYFLS